MKLPRKLRNLLFLSFIGSGVLPLIAVGIISLELTDQIQAEDISQKNLLIARSSAAQVRSWLASRADFLRQVETVISERQKYGGMFQTDAYLDMLINSNFDFEAIYVFDDKGIVLNTGLSALIPWQKKDFAGIRLSDDPYYKIGADTRGVTWSDTFFSFHSGRLTVNIGMPIMLGNIKGSLIGSLNLNVLKKILHYDLSEACENDGACGFITNRKGVLIAHPDEKLVREQYNLSRSDIVGKGLSGFEGTCRTIENRQDFLVSIVTIPETGWLICFQQSLRSAFRIKRITLKIFLAGIAVTGILMIIAAWKSVTGILIPLRLLTDAAEQVGAGNLDFQIAYGSDNELGILASAFNQMTLNLKTSYESLMTEVSEREKREEQIRRLAHHNELILNAAGEGICGLDMDGNVTFANPAAAEMTGYEPDELLGKNLHERIHHSEADGSPFPPASCCICNSMKSGCCVNVSDEILWRKDGSKFPAEYAGNPIIKEGKAVGAVVTFRDITARKNAEEKLRTALAEKDTLLQELYHRTRNTMQVISSMMKFRSLSVKDEYVANVFNEMENRIQAMSLVHNKLYESRNLSGISLKTYIADLSAMLTKSYRVSSDKIRMVLDTEDVYVLIDTAVPCGLILNELISNAIRHAFPGERQGEIRISLRVTDEKEIILSVSDNGIGLPQNFDTGAGGTSGIQTVFLLGEYQLRAHVKFESRNGLKCQICFKDNLYKARV